MTHVLMLPGIGGSGPAHWQSRWERLHPEYRRIEMPDWDAPRLDVWLERIEASVMAAPTLPVIVAHSLGCLAVAHWAARGGMLSAALLVAVPDPAGPLFPAVATGFAPVPSARLGFPTRVVASQNDPYGSFDYAARSARAWGAELCDVGLAGHINADSALGDWEAGQVLFRELVTGAR
jgi:predicted alpha/beta hydrolase family esterase